jgi:hypothetical protein
MLNADISRANYRQTKPARDLENKNGHKRKEKPVKILFSMM